VSSPPSAPGDRPLRAHRNLFNGDCNFLFYNPELWQPEGGPYRADAIHRYVDLLATSGVDTLLVNPNTQVAWYPSTRAPYILRNYRRGDREFVRPIADGNPTLNPRQKEQYTDHMVKLFDLYTDLTDAGVDWLAECATACRQRHVSPWLSYRMNATHFSGSPECVANSPVFHDPRNRLSGRVPTIDAPVQSNWIGLNYGRAAVRDTMFTLIRDGVESYDYEGLELDWLRHPLCVEPTASPHQIDEMTAWLTDLKALTRSRRAHYPFGLRVPGNLSYLKSIGLDLRTLARRGIIDFVTFSNYWQTAWDMPHDELRRELGPDITIYGGMEDAPNWLEAVAPSLQETPRDQELQLAGDSAYESKQPPAGTRRIRGTRYLTASAPFMRANAAGKLVLGVDGLAQFNFFVTDQVRVPGQRGDYAALRGLADLENLRGQEKHYAFNTASPQPTKIWDVPEPLPVRIAPHHRRSLRLPMCTEPVDADLLLIVQVIVPAEQADLPCGLCFNGAWPVYERERTDELLFPSGPYTHHLEEHAAWNYLVPLVELRDQWNDIVLANDSERDLDIVAVEVGVLRQNRPA